MYWLLVTLKLQNSKICKNFVLQTLKLCMCYVDSVSVFQCVDGCVIMLYFIHCTIHLSHLCLPLFLQYEPVIHPEAAAHVHHMILYICNDLDSEFDQLTPAQLTGGPCFSVTTSAALQRCSGQTIIAAWAVGGQVLFIERSTLPLVLCVGMSNYTFRK